MPKPAPHYDLSDAEKRDLVELIQKGRPFPRNTASSSSPTNARWSSSIKVIDIFGNDTMTLIPVTVP